MDAESPLRDDEFTALMERLGPFERRPHLAVAVSGGRDSLCLALLLHRWVQQRRGRITALTVDHRLRPESAAEAAQVRRWLTAHGITHRTLRWQRDDARPIAGGLQAAAREARYRLLCGACGELGILHLALAHQQDDQAETFLLRLDRSSGPDGLASIAPIADRQGIRLIRPLLSVPRARLAATLQAWGQAWIDDPTNTDDAYTRIRLRRLLPSLAETGVTPERLAGAAGALGHARGAMEDAVAALLAAAVETDPAGFLWLDPGELARRADEVSQRALARCLMAVGGDAYAPRLERLTRLHGRIVGGGLGGGATLAGCRVARHRDRLVICRELAAVEPPRPLPAGKAMVWDRRFAVMVSARKRPQGRFQVAALGEDGYRALLAEQPDLRRHPIPPLVRPVLPALWAAGKARKTPLTVPHLDYGTRNSQVSVSIDFVPIHALASSRFTVA